MRRGTEGICRGMVAGEWWQGNGGRGMVENGVKTDEEPGSADVRSASLVNESGFGNENDSAPCQAFSGGSLPVRGLEPDCSTASSLRSSTMAINVSALRAFPKWIDEPFSYANRPNKALL